MTLPEDTPHRSSEETLHEILVHLERMDRRDRLRTWGGFVRSIIAIIPIAFLILSTWYVYKNMNEILGQVAQQAAKSAAEYSKSNSQEFINSIKQIIPKN